MNNNITFKTIDTLLEDSKVLNFMDNEKNIIGVLSLTEPMSFTGDVEKTVEVFFDYITEPA